MRLGLGIDIPRLALSAGGWSPLSLFQSGEAGLAYDALDLSGFYSDDALTTQCVVNATCGSQRDARNLTLDAEAITNGDFTANLNGWTLTQTATASVPSWDAGVMKMNSDGQGFSRADQSFTTVAGRRYRVTGIIGGNAQSVKVGTTQGGSTLYNGINVSVGVFAFTFIATGATTWIRLEDGSGSASSFNSVSVIGLPGNHRYQSTTAERPILRGTPTGSNLVSNGGFDSGSNWTPGAGWAIGSGVATATASSAALTSTLAATSGRVYLVRYTMTRSAGTLTPSFGGVTLTARSLSGTYEEFITASSTAALVFTGAAFSGTADDASVIDYSADVVTAPYALQMGTVAGVDRWMQTAAVDFSATDEMTVCFGVRKHSDAAVAMVAELGTGNQNGSFFLTAPSGTPSPRFRFAAYGTSVQAASEDGAAFNAPVAAVLTGEADLSSPVVRLRVNGAVSQENFVASGASAFGNYPLYFGKRAGTGLPFQGLDYGGVIRGALTTAELPDLEQWVSARTPGTVLFDPVAMFDTVAEGAWYSIQDLTKLFQLSTGVTAVTAPPNPIGYVTDLSGNGYHATQPTSGSRPVLNLISSTVGLGSCSTYRLKFSQTWHSLLWPGPTGTYSMCVADVTGVQFYRTKLTNGERLPYSEFVGAFIIDREFTPREVVGLKAHYAAMRTGIPAATTWECLASPYTGQGGVAGAGNTPTWRFGDGTVYNTMFTSNETITVRESLSFSCSAPALLEELNIGGFLSGSTPDVSEYAALKKLTFSVPKLSGALPSLHENTALEDFDMGNSAMLVGELPDFVNNTSLRTFSASAASITGSIPSLSACTQLTSFNVAYCALTGSIPSLSGLSALVTFTVEGNQLTGPIPSLDTCTSLQQLWLRNNQLSGSIPSISGNSNLTRFRLEGNQLTGTIPNVLSNTLLYDLNVSGNQLTGSIPAPGPAMLYFYGYSNQLNSTIGDLSAAVLLEAMDFSDNQLTGYTGGASSTLGELYLQDNLLTQAAVDVVLVDLVAAGRTSGDGYCAVNLGGTGNATPSATGLADKVTLQGRGWTVTTN